LRKSILVAGIAAAAFSVAGTAHAQSAPSISVTASVSPTKAGTKAKPKAEKFKLSVKNDPASKTTAKSIKITFPSTLKLSTKGLPQCTASDTKLLAGPAKVCKSSIAGTGEANAVVNPFATTPAPLKFKVTPVVGKNELLFVLDSAIADAVLHGKIKGSTMTIAIPPFLQMPAPGTYSAFNDLTTTLFKTKGKNSLISSVGCKSKKHTINATIGFAPNPTQPVKPSASNSAAATCS
jgi:hypothetical protein